jgi:hypothetical protein
MLLWKKQRLDRKMALKLVVVKETFQHLKWRRELFFAGGLGA